MIDAKLINIERVILQPFKKNIFSLARGGIDKLYLRMYQLAEELAIHEMKKYDLRIHTRSLYKTVMRTGEHDDYSELQEKVSIFRAERLQHRMDEMKEILYKYLETEKSKKFEDLMDKYFKNQKSLGDHNENRI